jgi:hypothetical protein
MFAMYIVVAVLLVAISTDTNRSQVDRITVVLWVAFGVWSMCILSHFYLALGRRQYFAWGGFYVTLFTALFYLWTCASFLLTYIEYRDHEDTHDEMEALLVSIAITIYLDQRVIEPKFRSLYCYYQGVTSREELGIKPRISGISNDVLTKVAQNASKVIGLSVDQTNEIEHALVDQSIRKSEDEALDDWTVTLKQLTKVRRCYCLFLLTLSHLPNSNLPSDLLFKGCFVCTFLSTQTMDFVRRLPQACFPNDHLLTDLHGYRKG